MKIEENQVEKLCGFYVSDWHLVTMLLPYISSKIDEKAKIITILENNIEKNVKSLLEKLNLKNKEEILNIRWTNINRKKHKDIESILNSEISQNTENIILINGCKNNIEKNNLIINGWLKKNSVKFIKIIDFFDVTEFNNNIIGILNSHDKVLNTSGEKNIEDVFDGYKKPEVPEFKAVSSNN